MYKISFLLLFLSSFTLAATIIPFEREVSRLNEFSFMTSNNETSLFFTDDYVGDAEENLYSQGFSLINFGPNDIVTTTPEGFDFPHRNFSFIHTDKSRRDTHLWISDYNGSGRVSDFFETMLVFLPRENLMHVEENGDNLLVTLTTGEEVIFSKKDKMIIGGVLQESILDLNPNSSARKHVQIKYTGKGLMIRSDAKGADPSLVANVHIIKQGLPACKIAAKLFWTQEGFPKFKYVTDEEAYAVIKEHCGAKFLLN